VRLINKKHGGMAVAHLDKLIKGREIAIHAEQAVSDNKPPAVFMGPCEQVVKSVNIPMRKNTEIRPTQTAAVKQAGMVFLVAVNNITRADKGTDRAGIGGKTGWKDQRGLGTFKLGKGRFQSGVADRPTANQRTGPASPTLPMNGFRSRLNDA
jgi:hypothetical protein